MRKKHQNMRLNKKLVTIISLVVVLLMAGCSAKQQNTPAGFTQEKIQEILSAKAEVFRITWSPDKQFVLYLQQGKADKNGKDEVYLWQTGQENARFVRDVLPATQGFVWSPDSKYFLIGETSGEGLNSSIYDRDTLTAVAYTLKSKTIPVWSPDSKMLAYGNEVPGYEGRWGTLEVNVLGREKSQIIWKARDYVYQPESWDIEGNIIYTEINPQGQESKKSTKNIRPDISGVRLGDSREQVKKALGDDYKETPPGDETLNYPEPVYRWTYAKGYEVFIGKESGEVLEISATAAGAATNLGAKIGDSAATVFEIYRPKYIEPESIHGGKLYGLFKVEGGAALFFQFDLKEGQTLKDIKDDNKVERILLTYPELLDDSF